MGLSHIILLLITLKTFAKAGQVIVIIIIIIAIITISISIQHQSQIFLGTTNPSDNFQKGPGGKSKKKRFSSNYLYLLNAIHLSKLLE